MFNQPDKPGAARGQRQRVMPTTSAVLEDGALVELVYEPKARRTALAVWRGHACEIVPSLELANGARLVPYSPGNNLIRNDVILLPSAPEEHGSDADLVL